MTEKLLLRGAAKTEEITETVPNRSGADVLRAKREFPGEECLPDERAADLPGLQAGRDEDACLVLTWITEKNSGRISAWMDWKSSPAAIRSPKP